MELVSRFFKEPDRSFFLFGPRGAGKSTWVSTAHKDAITINLLEPEIYRSYSARPERLGEAVRAHPDKTIIAIDEIQKVPSLLDMVHQLIEEAPDRKFILTGSSGRKLKRAGVDLLAGRALLKTMHPFLAAELGAKFDLEKALLHGLLPLAVGSPNPREVLAGYAALYLKEEVQAEGLIRNVGQFARFLEAISFSHGSILNVSNIARDCEIERKTVESYIRILEDLLLAFRLPVFAKRAKRKTTEHPKFFLFDTGVFRALRPRGPLDKPQEIEGPALEGLVAQHLRAWNAYDGGRHELCFWRTRGGAEVNFVVHGERGLWAIEVKNDRKARDEDLRSLKSFLQDYPEARAILLYRGKERLLRGRVLCLPCGDFLKTLVPGKSPAEGL